MDSVEEFVRSVRNGENVELLVGVLVAFVVVLITAALLLRKRSKGSAVLLVGACNSGKTCLLSSLQGDRTLSTVASMQENTAVVNLPSGRGGSPFKVKLVDVPGHSKFRHKLEEHLKDAAGIVFVVDAVDLGPLKEDASDLLYDVLSSDDCTRRRVPVLIACNKSDLEAQAHSEGFIKKMLEKQLDERRKTKGASMGKVEAKESKLGKTGSPFSLTTLRNEVRTAVTSAVWEENKGLVQFILKCLQ